MMFPNEMIITNPDVGTIFGIFNPFGGYSTTLLFAHSYEQICNEISMKTLTLYQSKIQIFDLPIPRALGIVDKVFPLIVAILGIIGGVVVQANRNHRRRIHYKYEPDVGAEP